MEKKSNKNLKCQVLGTFESVIFGKKSRLFYDYMVLIFWKKFGNILKRHFLKKNPTTINGGSTGGFLVTRTSLMLLWLVESIRCVFSLSKSSGFFFPKMTLWNVPKILQFEKCLFGTWNNLKLPISDIFSRNDAPGSSQTLLDFFQKWRLQSFQVFWYK